MEALCSTVTLVTSGKSVLFIVTTVRVSDMAWNIEVVIEIGSGGSLESSHSDLPPNQIYLDFCNVLLLNVPLNLAWMYPRSFQNQ
jgi:hypothetical protein